ncbi:MAG TPA: hypothetical protein VEK33_13865 [Terriglobales bacterium]|nr:hypothetical protein [Terriglobales bacterium]
MGKKRSSEFAGGGQDLEAHQLQMNGMAVVGGINQRPDFRRPQRRPFRNRQLPMGSIQQQHDRVAGLVDKLVEGQQPILCAGSAAMDRENRAAYRRS